MYQTYRLRRGCRWYSGQCLLTLVMIVLSAISLATAQTSDTTPPQLVSFDFTPATIDLSAGPQSVTFTVGLTDDLSGVSFGANVFLQSPSFQFRNAFVSLTAGDLLNGTFMGTLEFPVFVESGLWTVSGISVSDVVGNFTFIDTTTLAGLGFPTQLTVLNSTPDLEAPVVTSLTFFAPDDPQPFCVDLLSLPIFCVPPEGLPPVCTLPPASASCLALECLPLLACPTPPPTPTPLTAVDVSDGPASVGVQLSITDNATGVTLGSFSSFCFPMRFVSPSGAQDLYVFRDFDLLQGTIQDGTWQQVFAMRQFSEPGFWALELSLTDFVGNGVFLGPGTLAALGFPSGLNVVSSPADMTPPTLQHLSFGPTVINTSTGDQSVRVRLRVTDDLAGADFSPTTPNCTFINESGLVFRSPSGQQLRYTDFFSALQLVSGTPQDGIWEGTVFFPQFSEEGTWRVDGLWLKDVTRNRATFDTAALQGRGFSTALVVARPSLVGDGSIMDPAMGGTVMDEVFGARAQITVPPGVFEMPTDVAIDVFSSPLDIPTPMGFQGPGTHFINIELTPEPTFPLPPPGLTIVLPLPNPRLPGTQLALFHVDDATGNLVPSLDSMGNPVLGTVDPSGLSATFVGITHLTIFVGLVPSVPGDINTDGMVDCADLAVVRAAFGKRVGQTGFDDRADVNDDGIVNVRDLAFVAQKLPVGTRCP